MKLRSDLGAIKFVLQGANMMCPGLTSPGATIHAEVCFLVNLVCDIAHWNVKKPADLSPQAFENLTPMHLLGNWDVKQLPRVFVFRRPPTAWFECQLRDAQEEVANLGEEWSRNGSRHR